MIFNKKWFTLIELMVTMTILIIVSTFSYIPYNYYQNKFKLNLAGNQISQSFYEAKSLAISWASSWEKNSSILLVLDNSEDYKNSIRFYKVPFDEDFSDSLLSDSYLEKTINLPNKIFINKIWDKDKLIFYFKSVSWELVLYDNDINELSSISELGISFWYWDQSVSTLTKELTYYTTTNIIDYK